LVDGHEILCYMLMAIWQDQYQFDFDEQKAWLVRRTFLSSDGSWFALLGASAFITIADASNPHGSMHLRLHKCYVFFKSCYSYSSNSSYYEAIKYYEEILC
jgi:hypothetical protein